MDEYKEVLYEHIPKLNTLEVGNLSARHALRTHLKCKSFSWFLHSVAPDLLEAYPPLEPVDFAFGALQSLANTSLCLDVSSQHYERQKIGNLTECSPDLRHPYAAQKWSLTFRKDLRFEDACVEVQTWSPNASLWLWPCHNNAGNQFWYYDRETHMMMHGDENMQQRCLEADLATGVAVVNDCDYENVGMKWHWGYVNAKAMNGFFKQLN